MQRLPTVRNTHRLVEKSVLGAARADQPLGSLGERLAAAVRVLSSHVEEDMPALDRVPAASKIIGLVCGVAPEEDVYVACGVVVPAA